MFSQEQKERAIDAAIERDEVFSTPPPVSEHDGTWLQMKEIEAHDKENLQYADVKRDLREQIRNIRRQVRTAGCYDVFWGTCIQVHVHTVYSEFNFLRYIVPISIYTPYPYVTRYKRNPMKVQISAHANRIAKRDLLIL